jgi:RNA polymerase sigma-70 factor (ECF subfamily)
MSVWPSTRITSCVRASRATKTLKGFIIYVTSPARPANPIWGITAMTTRSELNTEQLLDAASRGDVQARGWLLERHRPRLRRMVVVRLDRRVAARVDPSDVVQEALATAAWKLDEYLRERPLPFYPWLRRLAWLRLTDAHRRHLHAGRRSVAREEPAGLPDESVLELAKRLSAPGSGPSAALSRRERAARVRAALDRLPVRDREVLVLRYLEDLTTAEAAAVLGISEGAVKVRLLRALRRLRDLLDEEEEP